MQGKDAAEDDEAAAAMGSKAIPAVMIAPEPPPSVADSSSESQARARLRLQSIGWALVAGAMAGLLSLQWGLESSVRSAGCGLFYGLLAFHLERVDPEDSHLQAGLVGAICGVRSLGMPLAVPWGGSGALASLVVDLFVGWLPLVGSALLLHGTQRMLSASRP